MEVKPDAAPRLDSEVAAHRRWLITIALTITFGGFGAVMAYLSYASRSNPSASSPGRAKSPIKSPGTSPGTQPSASPSAPPTTVPAAPPTVAPPAAEPGSSEGDNGKPDEDK